MPAAGGSMCLVFFFPRNKWLSLTLIRSTTAHSVFKTRSRWTYILMMFIWTQNLTY